MEVALKLRQRIRQFRSHPLFFDPRYLLAKCLTMWVLLVWSGQLILVRYDYRAFIFFLPAGYQFFMALRRLTYWSSFRSFQPQWLIAVVFVAPAVYGWRIWPHNGQAVLGASGWVALSVFGLLAFAFSAIDASHIKSSRVQHG